MPPRLQLLVQEVFDARERFISTVGTPTAEQAAFRPGGSEWSIVDNVEHLTLAERSGTAGMWNSVDGILRGSPVWSGERVHSGRSIEDVIALTWKNREDVPAIAAPSWGGPVDYWIAALRAGQHVLDALGKALDAAERSGVSLEDVIYSHPISGPLDIWQRLSFLRFHIDRHAEQVRRIKADAAYPKTG